MKHALMLFAVRAARSTHLRAMACKHLLSGYVEPQPAYLSGQSVKPACALKVHPGPAKVQICSAHEALGLQRVWERECPYARDGRYPACQWFSR